MTYGASVGCILFCSQINKCITENLKRRNKGADLHRGVNAKVVGMAHRGGRCLVHEGGSSSAGLRVWGGKSDRDMAHITSSFHNYNNILNSCCVFCTVHIVLVVV